MMMLPLEMVSQHAEMLFTSLTPTSELNGSLEKLNNLPELTSLINNGSGI